MQQIIQKFVRKQICGAQVFNILFLKMQILNVFDHLFKSRKDRETGIIRVISVKYVKSRHSIMAGLV